MYNVGDDQEADGTKSPVALMTRDRIPSEGGRPRNDAAWARHRVEPVGLAGGDRSRARKTRGRLRSAEEDPVDRDDIVQVWCSADTG